MSRRKSAVHRPITKDTRYGDAVVQQFISYLNRRGKRSVAENILYDAIDMLEKRSGEESGLDLFHKGLGNVKPSLEVRSRRVGGATYQVPVEVRPKRRNALAMRWLIGFAKGRSEKTMAERLAFELLAASKNDGSSVKKKDDTHRMAEANKAFAHFRW